MTDAILAARQAIQDVRDQIRRGVPGTTIHHLDVAYERFLEVSRVDHRDEAANAISLSRLWCWLRGGHNWRGLSSFYDVKTGAEWIRAECTRCGRREAR